MPVNYEVKIEPTTDQKTYRITWLNLAAQTREIFDQSDVKLTQDELQELWLNPDHQQEIGQKLFHFLDGDARHLQRALDEAAQQGESLLLQLRTGKEAADWPFELLAQNGAFLLPNRMHLLRQVSDWGASKVAPPENRPLKLLFMACSAQEVRPKLDFEGEEEAIFRVTEKLPIDMEVEDSGSLDGLRQRLETEAFDVVHISGHADIDLPREIKSISHGETDEMKNISPRDIKYISYGKSDKIENIVRGQPFFIMENETGQRHDVFPPELWREALVENPPRVLFLSGCRTGETPPEQAATSFAQQLVEKFNVPAVLSWGRSVADDQATVAEEFIYHELSRGRDLLAAVQRARQELLDRFQDSPYQTWPLLRLYGGGMLPQAIVAKGQKARPKPRLLVHTFLKQSQVQVLQTGFVGRRRQLQQSLQALRNDSERVGVLLHGAGGLGKSCLAGKLCERFTDHTLIIVYGRIDAISLKSALNDAFIRTNDEHGLQILNAEKEMPEKLSRLCASSFKEKNYLFLFDNFEENLEGAAEGKPTVLLAETVPLLKTLLHHLPSAGKMTQLLITSRYPFSLTENAQDLAKERLEWVPMTSFQPAEQAKKARGLSHIWNYSDSEIAKQLLAAGHGNPRLMEWLNQLVGAMPDAEVADLLAAVRDKQEEFIQKHVICELLRHAGEQVERFLRCFSVYRLPVAAHGAERIVQNVLSSEQNWQGLLEQGVRLSLVENDRDHNTYWMTPILREELWAGLKAEERHACHEAAFVYYEKACGERQGLNRSSIEEWVYHALGCGREEVAARQGGNLITFLCKNLAYWEAKRIGEWVLTEKHQPLVTGNDAFFLNEFAFMLYTLGEYKKAITYYEQALKIDRAVSGDNHPNVARDLGNLGVVWKVLGENQKAIANFEQALNINRTVLGDNDQRIGINLNNLGAAWGDLGEHHKAIAYYEQALKIARAALGDNHPNVATGLNSLGSAWQALGEHQKAVAYHEQALKIYRTVLGDNHPNVAIGLSNLGESWRNLGEHQKAIVYYEQALKIDGVVFGDNHPDVATLLNNLGLAWGDLGEHQKAIAYHEQALKIDRAAFDDNHRNIARDLNNLAFAWQALGEHKKAIAYFEQAMKIDRTNFGDNHPNVANGLEKLGISWRRLGEHQKAIAYHEQALKINRDAFGDNHSNVAAGLNNLGSACQALGEHQKAIAYYEQALKIDRAVFGDNHRNIARDLNNLAFAWQDLSEHQKAVPYFEQAVKIAAAVFGDNHSNVAAGLNNLGSAWQAMGEHQKAVAYFEQAVKIDRTIFGDNHPNVARGLNNLGTAWHALGEFTKAIAYYEQSLNIERVVSGDNHLNVAGRLSNLGSAYFTLGEKQKAKTYFQPAHAIFNQFLGPEHPNTKTVAKWLAACDA